MALNAIKLRIMCTRELKASVHFKNVFKTRIHSSALSAVQCTACCIARVVRENLALPEWLIAWLTI